MTNLEWFQVAGVVIIFASLLIAWLSERRRANMWRDEAREAHKQIAWKGEEWHALNEEMRQTLEERDEWRRKTHDALEVIIRRRATIHILAHLMSGGAQQASALLLQTVADDGCDRQAGKRIQGR